MAWEVRLKIPDWFQLTIIALASFRVWRLLSEDTVLDWPRRKILRLGTWRTQGDQVPASYRKSWGTFLECGWCAGFWIALAWWGAFQWSPHWAVVVAVPWALSAIVGAIGQHLSS